MLRRSAGWPYAVWLLFLLAGLSDGTLTVDTYPTCAISGTPRTRGTLQSLTFEVPLLTGDQPDASAEVTGTLTFDKSSLYSFDCQFLGGQLVFVWVGDWLVCNTDPPVKNDRSWMDGSPQNPLVGKAGQVLPLVIHIYSASTDGSGKPTSSNTSNVSVWWSHITAPMASNQKPPKETIPTSALSPESPALEVQRRQLQRDLLHGWNTWSHNLLGVARLPHSFSITTVLCKLSSQVCLGKTVIEDTHATVRVGSFATDQSFWEFYLAWQEVNVSMAFTGGNGTLNILAQPLGCSSAVRNCNCSDFALVIMPRYLWLRLGEISVDNISASVKMSAFGMDPVTIRGTRPVASGLALPPEIQAAPHIAFTLESPVALREGSQAPTTLQVQQAVDEARAAVYAGYAGYSDRADVKEAIQASTLWNYIYVPTEYGPVLPVSRSWNFVKKAVSSDWHYVIFDWDNIFASYLTSLDPSSKNIAYSNFIQVIRARTARGFVPNWAAGGEKTVGRAEPPVGAKVLLEMYKRYKDKWLVELLFDDLLAWNSWFVAARLGPIGLVSLGSDTISGYVDSNDQQGGRYESGLDNSPMYDGDFFRMNVSHFGTLAINQMELYDVGMSSMFVQEAESLVELANVLGRGADAKALQQRIDATRKLIADELWDPTGGIFTNKFWNGSFYRRISPTSFYAMMAEAATDEQAEAMVKNWLLSPEHFCITPNGDFAGNSDDCYWGLPSIERNDTAFPPLGYWRGYVWGPMAMLTYWSLQRYDHLPIVRTARKALCKQMTALMMSQWNAHRHICENFSPHKTADDHRGDCSGTRFYHWGALNGLISMIEEGYYAPGAPTAAAAPEYMGSFHARRSGEQEEHAAAPVFF